MHNIHSSKLQGWVYFETQKIPSELSKIVLQMQYKYKQQTLALNRVFCNKYSVNNSLNIVSNFWDSMLLEASDISKLWAKNRKTSHSWHSRNIGFIKYPREMIEGSEKTLFRWIPPTFTKNKVHFWIQSVKKRQRVAARYWNRTKLMIFWITKQNKNKQLWPRDFGRLWGLLGRQK